MGIAVGSGANCTRGVFGNGRDVGVFTSSTVGVMGRGKEVGLIERPLSTEEL